MEEISRVNSAKINMKYFFNHHPMIKEDEIESFMYVSPYDIFIKFKNGQKYIYEQLENYLRPIHFRNNNLTEEEFKKEFGYRLSTYMNRHYISQSYIAKKLNTTQVMVSRYCNGLVLPSVYKIQLIAEILKYPLESFFYIDIDHIYNI